MIIDPSAHDPSDTDSLLKAFQFTLEASIARLKPGARCIAAQERARAGTA
jgi:hypothetical protein